MYINCFTFFFFIFYSIRYYKIFITLLYEYKYVFFNRINNFIYSRYIISNVNINDFHFHIDTISLLHSLSSSLCSAICDICAICAICTSIQFYL